MTRTAVEGDFGDGREPGCWCCGDRTVVASLLRLNHHQEVGVCLRCVDRLSERKRWIERTTRRAPPGPWWRRLLYRAGVSRCGAPRRLHAPSSSCPSAGGLDSDP